MNTHTLKAFEDELGNLKSAVAELGDLAEALLNQSLQAIADGDVDLAKTVVERDEQLAVLRKGIERDAVAMIARHAPMADDLRLAIAAIKMSFILERIGDFSSNIAKRALALAETGAEGALVRSILNRLGDLTTSAMRTVGIQTSDVARDAAIKSISELGALVSTRLRQSIDAYINRDVSPAMDIWVTSNTVDDRYCSLVGELIANMIKDTRSVSSNVHLLFVAKNLERIGDYAASIAEITHYETVGEHVESDRQKSDELTDVVKRALTDQQMPT